MKEALKALRLPAPCDQPREALKIYGEVLLALAAREQGQEPRGRFTKLVATMPAGVSRAEKKKAVG